MSYAQLESRVKRRLGRAGMTITNEFLDEMKSAQERLEEGPLLPKFLKTTGTETLLAGEIVFSTIPPANFIRVYDDASLTWVNEASQTKEATRLDTYSQLISKINNGIEEGAIYYFIDEIDGIAEIKVSEQSVDRDFILNYYGADTVLTGGNDNLWTTDRQQSLIMAMAGIELAIWLRDDRALQYFTGLEQRERARMVRSVEADEWGGMSLAMGDPD